jgi:hypothetical protein
MLWAYHLESEANSVCPPGHKVLAAYQLAREGRHPPLGCQLPHSAGSRGRARLPKYIAEPTRLNIRHPKPFVEPLSDLRIVQGIQDRSQSQNPANDRGLLGSMHRDLAK